MSEVYRFLTELLLEPPNGSRYPLVGGIGHHPGALPGRDNAILTQPTPSRQNA